MEEWDLPEIGMRRQSDRDRRAFFDGYVGTRPGIAYRGGNTFSRWRPVPGTDLNLALYVTNRSTGVFIRGPRGEPLAATSARLVPFAPELCAALGVPAATETCPFLSNHPMPIRDPTSWPAGWAWLARQDDLHHAAVLRIVAGVTDDR